MHRPKIAVVGAGVIGLSTAVRILDAIPTADLTVFAEDFPPNTTSNVAAGFWWPYIFANTPESLFREWSGKTLEYMFSLINSDAARYTGACLLSGYRLTVSDTLVEPFWKDMVANFRMLSKSEAQRYNGMKSGYFFTTVLVESSLYVDWLMKRIQRLGCCLQSRRVNNLQELVGENFDVIVNCTGLGARHIVQDSHVVPVRGQIVRVQAPWVKQFLICEEEEKIAYVFPSSSFAVLGGTTQKGVWSLDVNQDDKQQILDRCTKYMPSLKEARFDSDAVGLRPTRPEVRLESEMLTWRGRTVPVVHNYGHGGSGFTLHWGCAEHATKLVKQGLKDKLSKL